MTEKRNNTMSADISRQLSDAGVIAVLEIEELMHAVPVARSLLEGGVSAIELTLRTKTAMDAARAIMAEVPEILVGLGTVITTRQVEDAAKAGIAFAVAPGCNPPVIAAAQECGLSFAPWITTPTDIETAVEGGCRVLKYFPAESSGGMGHLKSIAGPYSYLGISYIPLGGLHLNNVLPYLESPLVCALGGSWLAKRELIREQQWSMIRENARAIHKLISQTKNKNERS